jgi:PiT family inorganic phosphate transporter
MFALIGGLFLGWALGANDSGNVFGTAVSSRIISYRKAIWLCAIAVVVGAVFQGAAGIHTLSGLTEQTFGTLMVISITSAFSVTIMTFLRMPISTSQALVGAISGVGLATGTMNWGILTKVVVCWLATPVGAMLIAVILYYILGYLFKAIPMSILTRDKVLWGGLIVVGVYGSYSLGANNVANATGIFSGQIDGISDNHLALIGGLAIAFGVLTFSKRVMLSVGGGIMRLDAFCAFVAVAAMAITVNIFAVIGVPVSTSQAIIGSIMGIGLLRGTHAIDFRSLRNMAFGWVMTPLMSLILSAAAYAIFCGVKAKG